MLGKIKEFWLFAFVFYFLRIGVLYVIHDDMKEKDYPSS